VARINDDRNSEAKLFDGDLIDRGWRALLVPLCEIIVRIGEDIMCQKRTAAVDSKSLQHTFTGITQALNPDFARIDFFAYVIASWIGRLKRRHQLVSRRTVTRVKNTILVCSNQARSKTRDIINTLDISYKLS